MRVVVDITREFKQADGQLCHNSPGLHHLLGYQPQSVANERLTALLDQSTSFHASH